MNSHVSETRSSHTTDHLSFRREELAAFVDQYEALLFDLDGTLVDTMPLHFRAYAEVLARRGLHLEEADFMAAIGEPARKAIPRFLLAAGARTVVDEDIAKIHEQKKQVFEGYLKNDSLLTLPAAVILDCARGRKRLGLVSSGNRAGVMQVISAMGWSDSFDIIVSGDDVANGKPHPESFLAAANSLQVAPPRCLVLEDTKAGLAAGAAAGMQVLDVTRLVILE